MASECIELSIIIPAYNEARTIRRIVEKIFQVNFPVPYELIIVDDSSKDRTYRIANLLSKRNLDRKISLVKNEKNRGKGFCIRRGFEEAKGSILIVQDADFEYDPSEIPALLEPVLSRKTHVVYGSRFLKRSRPAGMATANWVANIFLTWMTNLLYGCRLTDMETCYKVIRREVLAGLVLKSERFDFEPEVTSQICKAGYTIMELPISYRGRTEAEGKKIKARDFFIAISCLVKNLF